jgi:hypothetical protein
LALTGTVAVIETETAYGNIITDVKVQTETIVSTEAVVREYFSDIPVMIQVARCESTFRHTLADGTVLRGHVDNRDTGVMQINLGYHGETAEQLGLDMENIYDNMAYARDLYERQGTQPWSASRPCWGRTLASA